MRALTRLLGEAATKYSAELTSINEKNIDFLNIVNALQAGYGILPIYVYHLSSKLLNC